MQIAVLGSLQVRRDDLAPVPVSGPEERLLLAVLAAGAPNVVPADLLAEVLWDRRPPTEPVASLHDLVVGLRTTLEPGLPRNASGRHVLRRGGGYVLALSDGEVDSLRFTTLAARGHARLAERDAAGAHRMFTAALRLWRGEPYADWPDLPFAREQRQWFVAMKEAIETALIEAGRLLADEGPPPPQAAALPGAEPIHAVASPVPEFVPETPPEMAPKPIPTEDPGRPHADGEATSVGGTPVGEPAVGRRSRRRLTVAAAAVVTLVLAVVLAVRSERSTQDATASAEASAREEAANELAARSRSESPLDIQFLLAVQAFRLADTAETRDALLEVLALHPRVKRVWAVREPASGVSVTSSRTVALATDVGIVTWELASGMQPRVLADLPVDWGSLRVTVPSPTTDELLFAGYRGPTPWVRMMSLADGTSRPLLEGDDLDGFPAGGHVSADGRHVLLLLEQLDEGPPPRAMRWTVVAVDVSDGTVVDTGFSGTAGLPGGFGSVDFAQDGGSMVVWDPAADGGTLVDFTRHRSTAIQAEGRNGAENWGFRALPDGAAQLSIEGAITLFGRDGVQVGRLFEHRAPVTDAVVAPDGTWAASADVSGVLLRWAVDPETGAWTRPEPLTGHFDGIGDLEVDPLAGHLLSVSIDGTVIEWDMRPGEGALDERPGDPEAWVGEACAVVARDLTPQEWERYLPSLPYRATCSDLA